MGTRRVPIVETGVANIASLEAALRRLGCEPDLTRDASEIASTDYLVLPGVGAFGAGMTMLRGAGLVEPLRERIQEARPTLAICLGTQLLAEGSEESPGIDGLGIVDVTVERFPEKVRIPQFGWNEVVAEDGCEVLCDGYAYFANSYRIAEAPDGWSGARAEYGGSFIAAMERGPVLACQFHPEISGEWGHRLFERWLNRGTR